ncbi:hypothetical protein Taro_040774 [Colocasia esculenta]|uniref:Uncharacterized protein n=1 Tax=Colocasia esculenta TaxID=4460 RepID=A0A843WE17_COLES|nr:hypothetical protein [Colocasia esculenta]
MYMDCLPVHVGRPDDKHCLPVHAGRPDDRHCLPVHAGRPDDRDRLPVDHASSATFPFFLTTRWRASIQQRIRRGLSYLDGSHVGFQGKLDHFKLTAVDLSHAGSTPLTASPSGQYYY